MAGMEIFWDFISPTPPGLEFSFSSGVVLSVTFVAAYTAAYCLTSNKHPQSPVDVWCIGNLSVLYWVQHGILLCRKALVVLLGFMTSY